MEGPALTRLRSRSRSKTPFGDSDQPQKSGRKTPGGRNTPHKNLPVVVERETPEPETSSPAHRTRAAAAAYVTSDYSSEESPDVIPRSKEQLQNKLNTEYEYSYVSTTTRRSENLNRSTFKLSPSNASSPYAHSYNGNLRRSYSPSASVCSTDSSFAEQALADVSKLTEQEPHAKNLPYKLYKMAGEYWNKYPKTDYTYSPLSRDRVELAPGQVAVPNMSRRSLAHYRVHGDTFTQEELDKLLRQSNYDSSEEEYVKRTNGGAQLSAAPRRAPRDQRWWLTRLMVAVYTSIVSTLSTLTETVSGARDRAAGDEYARQHYARLEKSGIVRKAASAAVYPLVWIYKMLKTVVTTTTTTITNTISGNTEPDGGYYARRSATYSTAAARADKKRRLWPWLLLLPLIGYASHYTYENLDTIALPDFSNMSLDLSEFSPYLPDVTLPSLANISLPFALPNMTELDVGFPDIELGLPDIPEIPQAYFVYKEAVRDTVGDATDYVTGAASATVEQIRRMWNNVF